MNYKNCPYLDKHSNCSHKGVVIDDLFCIESLGKQCNILKELEQWLLEEIEAFSKGIPIEWDRVIEGEGYIVFYGFIPTQRFEKRDNFVCLIYYTEDEGFMFITSSAKYSQKLNNNLTGKNSDHKPCIKFNEFFKTKEGGN